MVYPGRYLAVNTLLPASLSKTSKKLRESESDRKKRIKRNKKEKVKIKINLDQGCQSKKYYMSKK